MAASGAAPSDDGMLDVQLRMPEELGGSGGGTNPEQLFAAAFAGCFHGADPGGGYSVHVIMPVVRHG